MKFHENMSQSTQNTREQQIKTLLTQTFTIPTVSTSKLQL